MGDITFEEAYQKTGRVLNIVVTPTTKRTSPLVLNYMTAPNVTVYSAILASCSVPVMFAPRRLYEKNESGNVVPRNDHQLYVDGSVRMDIPASDLKAMLNCSYIVSVQSNPHLVPFIYDERPCPGRPHLWQSSTNHKGGLVLGALEFLIKEVIFALLHLVSTWSGGTSLRDIIRQTHETDVVMIAKQRVRRCMSVSLKNRAV